MSLKAAQRAKKAAANGLSNGPKSSGGSAKTSQHHSSKSSKSSKTPKEPSTLYVATTPAAALKSRISYLHFISLFLLVPLAVRQITQFYGVSFQNSILSKIILSETSPWEMVWMFGTLVAGGLSQLSMYFNDRQYLRVSSIMVVCFNVVPIIYAMVKQTYDSYSLFTSDSDVFDKYIALTWYFFLVICVQIHGFTLYFGESLLSQWKTVNKRRRKQK